MKTLLVVALAAALAVAARAGPTPGPEPGAAPAQASASSTDQESQASEAVSKRGAARLTPVSGNSIVDNTVSNASPQPPLSYASQQQQQQQQQLQQQQQQQHQPQQLQPQQPLYAPHPYSFVAPQPHPSFFQYQPALPSLPPLAMLHAKYQAPGKQVLQYVPQPYFQVPQYQTPFMYLFPQPQAHPQAQPHQAQPGGQQQAGHPEQPAQPQQPQHQPHYVMVLSAPAPAPAPAAPVAAHGFQYFNHPQLALQPQQLVTFYAGPQAQPQQPQLQQTQPLHHLQHHQLQHHQPALPGPQTRFYPEQPQQLVFQQSEALGDNLRDGPAPPHFVPKQGLHGPHGLEAPAPPTPASLAGSYGARVPQPQHTYKTIIKA